MTVRSQGEAAVCLLPLLSCMQSAWWCLAPRARVQPWCTQPVTLWLRHLGPLSPPPSRLSRAGCLLARAPSPTCPWSPEREAGEEGWDLGLNRK